MATDVERLRYYERQFLGATDFTDEQDYHRDSLRRHLLGPHTWGIVTGLNLTTSPAASGTGVDVTIDPGVAVDAFGRPIVLLDGVALSKAPFESLPDQSTQQTVYVGLRYAEQATGTPAPGFQSCGDGGDHPRIVETGSVVVNVAGQPGYANDKVTVAGQPLDPTSTVSDYSIPYQELPDDASGAWTVPLGTVQWKPSSDPTVAGSFVSADATGRVYGGVVAGSVLAPDGAIIVQDRAAKPPATAPTALLSVEGTLEVAGLVTADAGLDVSAASGETVAATIDGGVSIDGGLQVQLAGSDEAVFGSAAASGGFTPQVTIAQDGTVTMAGQLAIGASGTGGNLLAVGGSGGADSEFTIASSGATQVGGALSVHGALDVRTSVSIHDALGGDDTDPLVLSRHQRTSDQNDLRVQIGDNLDGEDRFVVGPVWFSDGQFKEQFVVDNLGNVSAAGSLQINGNATVSGSLTVSGASNLIRTFTEELSIVMGATDAHFDWSVSHAGLFADVYARFAVWNGFSLWRMNLVSDWDTFTGHDKNVAAIPQHVFIRVTDESSTEHTSGIGYVSESEPTDEHDNSALFTVVVLGRGL